MLTYALKRLALAVPTMLALMLITFVVMKAVPGGPFDDEKALPPDVKAAIEKSYHFDEPVLRQFARYVSGALSGDLGPSYRYAGSRTVNEVIAESFPVSAQLGLVALAFAMSAGIPLGVLAARHRGGALDFSAMFLAIAGVSLPSYLVASVLILVFSLWLGWLPPALWEDWRSMVLPAVTLGLRPLAMVARLTRASLLETLHSDYVRTAEAKGLGARSILFKHALKNALIPVVTLLGPLVAATVAGSFVVEMIFAIPGMGKHFVSAVIDRDYTLIMGLTLVYGVLVIGANLAVDLVYGWIDPRMRAQT
ncbi:MAG: ABC transporter permease [Deltaproteobacteria bacterium]|nr:ABC transporter permease [Deltaproteobacteria bacterium]